MNGLLNVNACPIFTWKHEVGSLTSDLDLRHHRLLLVKKVIVMGNYCLEICLVIAHNLVIGNEF